MPSVTKMSEGEIAALRERLESEGFEFRSLDYAHFQARGPGVVVNMLLGVADPGVWDTNVLEHVAPP